MIDFDSADEWEADLSASLRHVVTDNVIEEVRSSDPEFIEDARDMLLELAGRDAVINTTLNWLRSGSLAAYHGSRLTSEEITAIYDSGLVPLQANARASRLTRALSGHPRWAEVSGQLTATIEKYGNQGHMGQREGQVHLTLSISGLTNGFNHYLTHGSEFDQHVARSLLGDEGLELLGYDGEPAIVIISVPGTEALAATHPYISIEDMQSRGDVPNIVDEFLCVWSYRLVHPGFESRSLEVDCGMIFRQAIKPEWIVRVYRGEEAEGAHKMV